MQSNLHFATAYNNESKDNVSSQFNQMTSRHGDHMKGNSMRIASPFTSISKINQADSTSSDHTGDPLLDAHQYDNLTQRDLKGPTCKSKTTNRELSNQESTRVHTSRVRTANRGDKMSRKSAHKTSLPNKYGFKFTPNPSGDLKVS